MFFGCCYCKDSLPELTPRSEIMLKDRIIDAYNEYAPVLITLFSHNFEELTGKRVIDLHKKEADNKTELEPTNLLNTLIATIRDSAIMKQEDFDAIIDLETEHFFANFMTIQILKTKKDAKQIDLRVSNYSPSEFIRQYRHSRPIPAIDEALESLEDPRQSRTRINVVPCK